MIRHYIIIAWRNLLRNKILSFIQIIGLSLGITTFLLAARYTQYETTYDKHYPDNDRIYRVQSFDPANNWGMPLETPFPLANYLKENFPEVESVFTVTRLWDRMYSSSKKLTFKEDEGYVISKDVFEIFPFKFLKGDPEKALDEPNVIILSETLANKYFPNQEAYGKILLDGNKNELKVTGVFEDIPKNSHIRSSYLVPMQHSLYHSKDNWERNGFLTYIKLNPGVSKAHFDKKIENILIDHIPGSNQKLALNPLSDCYINPYANNNTPGGELVFYYSLIAILVLILASLNFMNLSTAFSSSRYTEIGIRKVSGGKKSTLIKQFITESVIISIFSMCIAFILSKGLLPFFNNVVRREITLDFFQNSNLVIVILLVTIITGILSGIYPSLIMSSFKPVSVLKGLNPFGRVNKRSVGIKGMVCFQFTISAILIAISFWVNQQVNFMEKIDLGFEKQNLYSCAIPPNNHNVGYNVLKNEILSHPGVESFTVSGCSPMINSWGGDFNYEGNNSEKKVFNRRNRVNSDFLNTFKIELLKGRNFSENFQADQNCCLVNEAAVKATGWTDPLEKWIEIGDRHFTVIGVVKDFHSNDYVWRIHPNILLPHDKNLQSGGFYTFCINPGFEVSARKHINNVLEKFFPDILFDLLTYNQAIDKEDITEWSAARNTFVFFTILSILIAAFGLFALVVFSAQKRIKEIGVRKVQGAKSQQIWTLLLKEFFILLVIANIIAIPVPEIFVNITPGILKYHFHFWEYLVVISISFLIAVISGSYYAIKAARKNPVEALRYE